MLMNRTFNAIALTALVEIANGRPVMIQEPMAHSAGRSSGGAVLGRAINEAEASRRATERSPPTRPVPFLSGDYLLATSLET